MSNLAESLTSGVRDMGEDFCACGNPISETTAHVPCVDCARCVMVAEDESDQEWRCGRCGGTAMARAASVRVAGDEQDRP